ncbi:MAG: hypothetical protein KFB96_06750 [Thiocapsa sp.]|nr:MAG: hypothetical protein KFB96_06750 [Thiocapsa sp.]
MIPAARPMIAHLKQHGMYLSETTINRAMLLIGELVPKLCLGTRPRKLCFACPLDICRGDAGVRKAELCGPHSQAELGNEGAEAGEQQD